eukprot:TRINITY_DN1443_c0_g1_i1.p1 TRINITY_DN1443_c0_g1~~TRINITY_DN1443_c0_g1_i1.p1  ORF type:complete len:403 (-),score=139.45 TRINITY_DN1443_c0_g1_i1:105-1313(-)
MASPTEANREEFATTCSKRYPVKGPVDPLATPIFASSTFVLSDAVHGAALCERASPGDKSPWLYTRWGNPTTDVAEQAIAAVEGGEGGAFVTASGMAAITAALMSFVKAGDHIVAPAAVYGGTHELLRTFLCDFGVEVSFVDATEPANYDAAVRPNTKMLYGETPANPNMAVLDLDAFAAIAKKHSLVSVVDSTFASPFNQQPLRHGVDIVVHSATKYLGGHSDLLAGCIVCAQPAHYKVIMQTVKLFGATLSAFDSFLLARGIKTLDVRMRRHNKNALKVAQALERNPKVARVFYPGLQSHPQHELAKRQMRGFGGMLAFEVVGGMEAARKLIESTKLVTLAVSLGGVESLVEHAASMTHTMVPREQRLASGITDGLIRLSVGIEGVQDLIADLEQALDAV